MILERVAEQCQELASETPTQDPNREEEVLRTRHPASSVQREPSGGRHAADVGMVEQLLTPCVEEGQDADPIPKVTGIGSDFE